MGEDSRANRSFRGWAGLLLAWLWLAGCSAATSTPPPSVPGPNPAPIAETLVVNTAAPSALPPIPTGTALPTGLTSSPGALTAVSGALRGLLHSGPFRFHTVISTPDGKTMMIDGEAVPPDSFHLLLSGEEILFIGGQTYSRQGGAWTPAGSALSGAASGLLALYSSLDVQVVTDAVLTGTDLFAGTSVHIYRYDSQVILDAQPVEVENRVWISDATGLPLRLETDGAFNGQQSQTVQDFLPDPSIVIAAPTP